ncbi:hypothetical protein [Subdoligranulum variabile]|uniref:hypothetical protein n=1 Tax=Subdoligranulum variabile TaxID=214851 RepID=UPI0026EB6690|nr:hypothetical protein [Subdoligranulum variabile]
MKRAIATLLSFCMMFSIMAQGPVAMAEEYAAPEAAVQTEAEELATAATPETGTAQESQDVQDDVVEEEAATIAELPQEEQQDDEETDSDAPQSSRSRSPCRRQAAKPLHRTRCVSAICPTGPTP